MIMIIATLIAKYYNVLFCNSAFKWVYLSFSPLPFASLLFIAICEGSSDNHFAFLHDFFLGITGGLDHTLLYNVFTTNARSIWEEILFKHFFIYLVSYFWLC